jgi:2-furoate---CoA ligase
MNVASMFQKAVERTPDQTALVDPEVDQRFTYAELDEYVRKVGSALTDVGISAGDRVSIATQNRIELVTLYWACQHVGAAFVPYNFRASASELAFLVDNTEPEILFFSDVNRQTVDVAREEFEVETLVFLDEDPPEIAEGYESFLDNGSVGEFDPTYVDEDETSLILHSSGTTGQPKAIPRSHRNTYSACVSNNVYNRLDADPVMLGVMPMYHTMGIRTIGAPTLLNGKLVVQQSFTPEQTLALIENEGITSMNLIPTIFHDLLECHAIEDTDLSTVKSLKYAGMPMTERVEQQVRDAFEPEVFVNYYGSSEVYTMSVCSWLDEKPGCAGRAGYNTRVRVVDPNAKDPGAEQEPGEIGEIILDASSPEAFDGYLNRPDANEKSFQDGWFFTDDSGYRDEEGDLFVVGRVDDMIISGGENIYPVEVENVLDRHDQVTEVAVTGFDDERWNQVVVAFCTTPDDVEDYESLAGRLEEFLHESEDIADFKRPRRYIFTEDLPKSRVGKLLHRELDESLEGLTVYGDIEVSTLSKQ